jgi:hypothetical protein
MIKEEPKETITACDKTKRCSEYTEDCNEVHDHFSCWSGVGKIDVADGICPFIHTCN